MTPLPICHPQSEEKVPNLKKEESREEEEGEDEGSTANAEEYDPMEAEDADEEEDNGSPSCTRGLRSLISIIFKVESAMLGDVSSVGI